MQGTGRREPARLREPRPGGWAGPWRVGVREGGTACEPDAQGPEHSRHGMCRLRSEEAPWDFTGRGDGGNASPWETDKAKVMSTGGWRGIPAELSSALCKACVSEKS